MMILTCIFLPGVKSCLSSTQKTAGAGCEHRHENQRERDRERGREKEPVAVQADMKVCSHPADLSAAGRRCCGATFQAKEHPRDD